MPPPGAPQALRGRSYAPPPKTSKLIKGKATASRAPSGWPAAASGCLQGRRGYATKATGLLGVSSFNARPGHRASLPYAQSGMRGHDSGDHGRQDKARAPRRGPVFRSTSCGQPLVKELDSAWYRCHEQSDGPAIRSIRRSFGQQDKLLFKSHLIPGLTRPSKPLKLRQDGRGSRGRRNATVVLQAELEELAKARKGAEEKAARRSGVQPADPKLTLLPTDRAYHIAECDMRTFIPPPPDVKDYLDEERMRPEEEPLETTLMRRRSLRKPTAADYLP
ncbi:hypothetical protein QYE76_057949 [Lolium multiflorum]|uniref:Uncharacterized protein n=1 Tax=Lolium multiflorum TaxID=4521 RepID=A0AAD8WS03_LOLMU|nr:hypothetical protein QYE76_057949 [Lolium multiflorum]